MGMYTCILMLRKLERVYGQKGFVQEHLKAYINYFEHIKRNILVNGGVKNVQFNYVCRLVFMLNAYGMYTEAEVPELHC